MFKNKGDQNDCNRYRGIAFSAFWKSDHSGCSAYIAGVIWSHLHRVTEGHMYGFRSYRSSRPLCGIFFLLLLTYSFEASTYGEYIHTRHDRALYNLARIRAQATGTRVLTARCCLHMMQPLLVTKLTEFSASWTYASNLPITNNPSLNVVTNTGMIKAISVWVWENKHLALNINFKIYQVCFPRTLFYDSERWTTYETWDNVDCLSREKTKSETTSKTISAILSERRCDSLVNKDYHLQLGMQSSQTCRSAQGKNSSHLKTDGGRCWWEERQKQDGSVKYFIYPSNISYIPSSGRHYFLYWLFSDLKHAWPAVQHN